MWTCSCNWRVGNWCWSVEQMQNKTRKDRRWLSLCVSVSACVCVCENKRERVRGFGVLLELLSSL